MLVVVIRWQVELSKKCLPARYVKLAAVHGAFAVSTATLITPRFVVIVMVSMPDLGSPGAGGMPTFLISDGSGCGVGVALGSTRGSQAHADGLYGDDGPLGDAFFLPPPVVAATSQVTPAMTTTTSAPAATMAWTRRRRAARSAR